LRFHPAALFCVFSLLAGIATIAATPPLRGPDENAHFLRAYGLAQGDIIPGQRDEDGRKGLFLPAQLHAEFDHFDAARASAGAIGFEYRQVFAVYQNSFSRDALPNLPLNPVFTPYGGSEGYTPVAYLPYVAAAAAAEIASLDFLTMLYVMRFAGLLAVTAIIAYAIARTPVLPWGFFAIAMLPSAVFGRSVISADGMVLASTLVVTALCLRAATAGEANGRSRAVWMTLSALTKPSQIVFALLELMARPLGLRWRRWAVAAAVIVPGILLTALWVRVVDADVAAWRIYEGTGVPAEQFKVGWKLQYMAGHPLQFPAALFGSLDFMGELWRQLVGVLGWLDTPLHALSYPAITILLIAACLDRLDVSREQRWRIVSIAAFTVLSYWLFVFLLFWVTFTPVDSGRVLGVQGRYFVMVLPLVALIAAALLPRKPPALVPAGAAILLALVSSVVTVKAILRTTWS
jgi:uncharacterized membrane protein